MEIRKDIHSKLAELAAKMPPIGKALNAQIAAKRLRQKALDRHSGKNRTSKVEREKFYERMKDK